MLDCPANGWPCRVDRLCDRRFRSGVLRLRSYVASPEKVDAPVVCDPKQPRSNRAAVIVLVQTPIRIEQGILDDIFAIERRPGHAGAVAMELRPQRGNSLEKR